MKIFNPFILLVVILTQLINSMTLRDKILEPYLDGPKKELFKMYHQIYNKKYDLNSEEGIRRYRIFKDSLKYIEQENAKGHSHKLGITPFADMTNEEYIEKTARPVELMKEEIKEMSKNSSPFLSKDENLYAQRYSSVDWTKYSSGVKDQGECGSCWAFSGTSAVESNYNILTGKSVRLSNQQLVDCDFFNHGCDGGTTYLGLELLRFSGAALENDYPYTAKQESCKYDSAKGLNIVKKTTNCGWECPMDNWVSMLKQGPMAVIVDSRGDDFKLYKSGIIDLTYCKCTTHAVVAVALLNGDGFDYIKILNSWSEDWGDHGYMNVKYNPSTFTCYITREAFLPIVNSDPTPLVVSKPSFYSECDYIGLRMSSDIPLKSLISNDGPVNVENRVNSIKTFGYDVTIYDDYNCKGKAFKFNGDEKCFSTSLNPDAKLAIGKSKSASIVPPSNIPKDGCISLYKDTCFSGVRQEICNDKISLNWEYNYSQSLLFGAGVKKVIIFTDISFKGISYEFSSSNGSLTQDLTMKLFGNVKSIKILK